MWIKIICFSMGFLLSGCTAVLTSQNIPLDLQPAKHITVGIHNDNIDVSKTTAYSNYKQDIHNTLLSESKGMVNELANQTLTMSIAFSFQPEFDANPLIGIPSFFLPFLSFIPESNNEVYSINYAISDRLGNVVHQRSLKGNVEGYIKGYYIGRLGAAKDLRALEGAFAAKNAARLVLKDIDANSEKLFAAANAVHSARAFSATKDAKTEPSAQPVVSGEYEAAYQQAKSLNTMKAYTAFLQAYPSSPNRRDALAAMVALIKQQRGSYESYKKFVLEFEDGMELVPSQHRLVLIGPEGMRVYDILKLLGQGIEDKVIAAKIRMQNAIYKDFDFEEIGALKKRGMTGTLIEAMLDSTTRAKRAQDELQKKKEMENLLAEIQGSQKKLETMKATQEQQGSQAPASSGQGAGPSVGETVKNCAAQIAALEACKHLPWPASTLCAATAKSQFPCQ